MEVFGGSIRHRVRYFAIKCRQLARGCPIIEEQNKSRLSRQVKVMENTCYLPNGQSFVINPDKEGDPVAARYSKKMFMLGLNTIDLSTDKAWTAGNIRALATGMVQIVLGDKKRATKAVFIERLAAYIMEERLAASITDSNDMVYVETVLGDCSFSTEDLKRLMETLVGKDLVDALAALILSKNLAPSTITKTALPQVGKLLTAFYKGADLLVVRGSLYKRFQAMNQQVNTTTAAGVVEKCHNRAVTDWKILAPFVDYILDNIETVTWKHLSFALSIATGRRRGEVHGIGTSFSVVDSGLVLFSGQLKTKTKGVNPPTVIPCLFDAYKVVAAWNKLREVGRASYAPEGVNNAVGKALSCAMPEDVQEIKQACNLVAYKDNRDCYAAYCVLVIKPQFYRHYSTNAYLALIMGHGENDLATATTYDKREVTI